MQPLLGRVRHILSWGECDPAGIIYYPTYYRWMDTATWTLVASAGYRAARMRDEHFAMPLVNAQCEFVSSPTFGDECEVRSFVSRFGRSSFTVQHEVVMAEGERVLARGSESRVWCRYESGPGSRLRAEPMPADLRSALGLAGA
ncbi:MAG TPA: acyl-CoA thioesterase [Ramlibacter sp.]|uniref:acyl-CoA thioesterase n=1 Tax=Ramlibacter sp. TaxID=1917967 RepID=UPI002BECF1BE|nr:acyl-CoA thioesterase [Ramlibacter sp.]HVZ42453.1 acyl-CoA thioesterase [Ramlibacter sp.]